MDLLEFHDFDDIIYFIVVREAKNIIIFDAIDTFLRTYIMQIRSESHVTRSIPTAEAATADPCARVFVIKIRSILYLRT